MTNASENVNLKLAETKLSIEQILTALNKTVDDIKKIYVGDTYGCRCGCHGKYHNIGTRGAKMAFTKIVRLMNEDKFINWKNIDYTNPNCYLDIPYISSTGAERSVCFYFNK